MFAVAWFARGTGTARAEALIALTAAVTGIWVNLGGVAAAQSCNGAIVRTAVARCAVDASLSLVQVRAEEDALEGRRLAVTPLLPANPALNFSAARRSTGEQQATNWYATLSQELEIAGQRSARQEEVSRAIQAQRSAVGATERDVAAHAWRSYFEALAARDALEASTRLEQVVTHASAAARASAEQGLVSMLDAEVSELNALRLTEDRLRAQGQAQVSVAALSTLLGRDPAALQMQMPDGELTPLAHVERVQLGRIDQIVEQRPEVLRLKELQRSKESARSVLERSRIPNVTLSLTAQRDGFGEQVFGGGIAIPIPLPYPVGRTFHGELTENAAQRAQVISELEQQQRSLRLQLVTAWHAHAAAKAQFALYTNERVERAMRSFEQLAQALQVGSTPISEAVVAQQTLIEFLRSHIRAKLELCLTSVELARSAGLALWGEGL